MIKILIADDHPIFRKGLIEIISSDKNLSVAAEAGDGEKAIQLIKEKRPDIAVLDIQMPKLNGFDVARQIAANNLNTKIIFLTMHKEHDLFNKAVELGALGYILKECAVDDIIECINEAAQGKHYVSDSLSEFLFIKNKEIKDGIEKEGLDKLSLMEKKILKLISEKKTSQEIADALFISIRTVENHRLNICKKLDIHGVNSLIKFAIEIKHLL